MPLLSHPSYRPPRIFRNCHINTIYPNLVRKVREIVYQRERVQTPDHDFLDLDWSPTGSSKLILVLHGLEGSADRPYVKGMIRHFNRKGWDGVGLNFRSCSGEMNRSLRVYHSGETGDLEFILDHIRNTRTYQQVALIGFSLGGNVALKYLGERGKDLPEELSHCVAVSTPCDLTSSSAMINDRLDNQIYLKRFMRHLNKKLKVKLAQFPGQVQLPNGRMPRNFTEFDDYFTAPVHGFRDARDYWKRASSRPHLPNISIPTLMLNAWDDSFLGEACYPVELAEKHPFLHLEIPQYGGHVGFAGNRTGSAYYSEQRAFEFITV